MLRDPKFVGLPEPTALTDASIPGPLDAPDLSAPPVPVERPPAREPEPGPGSQPPLPPAATAAGAAGVGGGAAGVGATPGSPVMTPPGASDAGGAVLGSRPGRSTASEAFALEGAPEGGGEEVQFLQVMAPTELVDTLATAKFEVALSHRRLCLQRRLVGGLLLRYLDRRDADALSELAELVEAWHADPLSRAPANTKLGWRIPAPIKRELEGVVLALRQPPYRFAGSDVSARLVVCALIWRHVDPTPAGVPRLVELAEPYYHRFEAPAARRRAA